MFKCKRIISGLLLVSILTTSTPAYALGGDWLTAAFQGIESFRNFFSTTQKWGENIATLKKQFMEYKKIYQQGEKAFRKIEQVSKGIKNMQEIKDCFSLSMKIGERFYDRYDMILHDDNFSYAHKLQIAQHMKAIVSAGMDDIILLKTVVNSNTSFSFTDHERWKVVYQVKARLQEKLLYFDDYTHHLLNFSAKKRTMQWSKKKKRRFYGVSLGL